MARRPQSNQIYVRPDDKRRLEALAKSQLRTVAGQLAVLLNEYEERHCQAPGNERTVPAGARRTG